MPRQMRRTTLARFWRAFKNFSPTPRRPRRQNHPNLFLLGFRPKLMTIAYFQKTLSVTDGHFQPRVPAGRVRGAHKKARVRGQGPGGVRAARKPGHFLSTHPAWTSLRPPGPWTRCGEGSGPPGLGALGFRVFTLFWGPELVLRRTCSGTGPIVGATDLLAAGGEQATWADFRHRGRRA